MAVMRKSEFALNFKWEMALGLVKLRDSLKCLTFPTVLMFTIHKRFARQVPVYKLKFDANEILDGTFCEPELQIVIKNDDLSR